MKKHTIQKRLEKKGYLIADGATGTELIGMGVLKKGMSPEHLFLESPEAFVKIHRSYYDAGSDYVVANNFGGSRTKLEEWNLTSDIERINRTAVQCVKKALKESGKDAFVASSIGPTGRLLPPIGGADIEEIIEIFKEQIKIIYDEGVDLFVLETMTDMREAKAAYIAIRDICDIPVGISLTYDAGAKTLFNNSPESVAVTFDSTDILFIGANCSVGPRDITSVIQRLGEYTDKPILVKPNAGVGEVERFSIDDFTSQFDQWIASGARVFGGCCSTTPEYIKVFSTELSKKKIVKKLEVKPGTHFSSLSRVVSVGPELPPIIIGERINPTNKKDMTEELKEGRLDIVREVARKQVEDGANMLDINLSAAGVDEVKLMSKTFQMLGTLFDTPLVVDSTKVEAIEAALRAYGGKVLINSTTADSDKAEKIFKLASRYGAAVIGLTMNESGIPMTAGERFKLAKWLKDRAGKFGIKPSNLVIDTLTLSLSSNQKEAMETIEAIRMVRSKLNLCTVLGVSNVSYGMPERANLNQAFLTIAIDAGLNCAIINPSSQKMRAAFDSMNVIKGFDSYAVEYVKRYADTTTKAKGEKRAAKAQDPLSLLREAIVDGDDVKAVSSAKECIKEGMDIVEIATKSMVPGIEVVGKYFKDGRYFLPQVVLSAQAMKKAFDILKSQLKDSKIAYRGRVVMATVKGDIHDIGKNIVITLLETNGFEVIDIGKSIPASTIVAKAKELTPDVIGLSSLMTTTMEEMGVVIEELDKEGMDIPVMVGGAVVTKDFAKSIGAKLYARDAMEAVELLQRFLKK